jgi:hypothetical protein
MPLLLDDATAAMSKKLNFATRVIYMFLLGVDKLGEQRQRVVAWRHLGDAVLP